MDLRDYLESLWRRKWIIVVTVVVTTIITTVGTLWATPQYVASATLRAAPPRLGGLDYSAVNIEYAKRLLNTYVEIATSGPVLDELRTELGVSQLPEIEAVALFDTELIRISVTDSDPILARETANTLAKILVVYGEDLNEVSSVSSQEILAEQLEQIEGELAKVQAEYEQLAFEVPVDSERLASIQRTLELKQETYARILRLYEEARLSEATQGNTISIVEPATTPFLPSQPNMKSDIALGFAVGLVGGVVLAIAFETLDTTLYTVDKIEQVTDLPALGRISTGGGQLADSLVESDSLQAEDLRRLYANILALDHDPAPRTLLVTSAGPDEGKSFVTANLAPIIAQTQRRVVVVDGDPWQPNQHDIYDLPNNVGLSSVLAQTTPLSEAVQKSSLPGVHVLTAGPPLPTSDESPRALQMPGVLEELAGDYDVVLLDTPAFQAVADAAMLAPQVDGVMLVVGLGQAKKESVQDTRQELARVRANVLGVVVNRFNPDAHSKYYKQTRLTSMEDSAMAAVAPEATPAKILVVEDDASLAKLMNTRLSKAGYEIEVTDNGETALQIARRWKPDLVILDVILSDKVDGFEVSQQIRQTRKLATVPIIMVTARVDYDAKLTGFETGADDYITKPFDVEDLALRVAALLRRAQVGSGGQWPSPPSQSSPVSGDSNGGSDAAQEQMADAIK
jgi:capsular exopolysaccharide synthesis family protein